MREHEVPTHVQAEDRVLLWFTFPQIVALTAVAALAYGIFRYAPVGPETVRVALAGVFALVGAVLTAGQVRGRRLPAVAADLLRFTLGARRYEGPAADLVRCEAPPPPPASPGLLTHLAQKARRRLRRERRDGERRNGRRMPGLGWLRNVRRRRGNQKPGDDTRASRRSKHARREKQAKRGKRFLLGTALAAAALAAALLPQAVLAQGQNPGQQQWRSGDIGFQPPAPVSGRRIFVEALEVSGGRAKVTLRAATSLDLRAQAYGGPGGRSLVTSHAESLITGQGAVYDLPLDGDAPSFTFAWVDRIGQAGAVSLQPQQLPHPLPAAEGDICDLRVTSLSWRPRFIEGRVASTCVTSLRETLTVDTVTGHHSEQAEVVRDGQVTAVTGTVTVRSGDARVSVPFVRGGETPFSLAIGADAADHQVSLAASLRATLTVALPPVVELTHHPARVERVTKTVHLHRPGDSDWDSQTVTATCNDGTTSSATATAYASVSSATIARAVTVDVQHKEHVRAQVVPQGPVQRTRLQQTDLRSAVHGDTGYQPLPLPTPEPEPPLGTQTPSGEGEVREHFRLLGWAWPW